MIKIGITGGIGSGKSTVASLLELQGIPVYVADKESKKLTTSLPAIREGLTALFGTEIYTDEGLNKRLLASLIFGNPEYLKQVNGIIHPEVKRHFCEWAAKQPVEICAIESAILFESGFDSITDKSLMVYAPLPLRIERTVLRDEAAKEEVAKRIGNQLSDEIKRDRSDYVILNDDRHALLPQVEKFLDWLEHPRPSNRS